VIDWRGRAWHNLSSEMVLDGRRYTTQIDLDRWSRNTGGVWWGVLSGEVAINSDESNDDIIKKYLEA